MYTNVCLGVFGFIDTFLPIIVNDLGWVNVTLTKAHQERVTAFGSILDMIK